MTTLPKNKSSKAIGRDEALRQKAACSPRTAIAISAWSSWTRILAISRAFHQRIAERHASNERVCVSASRGEAFD